MVRIKASSEGGVGLGTEAEMPFAQSMRGVPQVLHVLRQEGCVQGDSLRRVLSEASLEPQFEWVDPCEESGPGGCTHWQTVRIVQDDSS